MINFITAVLLIVFAAFSRLLPHPMNFAPITAIALFSGAYLNKKYAFIVPIAAMIFSDYFLGFYRGIEWVYGSFVVIALVGLWLKGRISNAGAGKKTGYIFATALVSSIIFFVLTNFGVWISGTLYEVSYKGFLECYAMAIPFYRNTFLGDMVYAASMFGVYELITKYAGVPKLQQSKVSK